VGDDVEGPLPEPDGFSVEGEDDEADDGDDDVEAPDVSEFDESTFGLPPSRLSVR
jgi:hypothetical protein